MCYCGAYDCPVCHPELQEKVTCVICGCEEKKCYLHTDDLKDWYCEDCEDEYNKLKEREEE